MVKYEATQRNILMVCLSKHQNPLHHPDYYGQNQCTVPMRIRLEKQVGRGENHNLMKALTASSPPTSCWVRPVIIVTVTLLLCNCTLP